MILDIVEYTELVPVAVARSKTVEPSTSNLAVSFDFSTKEGSRAASYVRTCSTQGKVAGYLRTVVKHQRDLSVLFPGDECPVHDPILPSSLHSLRLPYAPATSTTVAGTNGILGFDMCVGRLRALQSRLEFVFACMASSVQIRIAVAEHSRKEPGAHDTALVCIRYYASVTVFNQIIIRDGPRTI